MMRFWGWVSITGAFALLHPTIAQAEDLENGVITRRVVRVGDRGKLRVSVRDADIEIRRGGTGEVRVEAVTGTADVEWARKVFARIRFDVDQRGDEVRITVGRPKVRRSRRRDLSLAIRVTMPPKFGVYAKSRDGDVAIGGLRGTVKVRIHDGDIRIDDLVSTSVDVSTRDGSIVVRGIRAGKLAAETRDGNILAIQCQAGSTKLHTRDGNVQLVYDKGMSTKVNLRGERVSLAGTYIFDGYKEKDRIEGEINEGGPKVDARTRDGIVKVTFGG